MGSLYDGSRPGSKGARAALCRPSHPELALDGGALGVVANALSPWTRGAMSRLHQIATARARFNRALRAYFDEAGYLEVETPALVPASGMEPHIDPFRTRDGLYLHTSPEYAMKRLLAEGLPRIYQLSRVYRLEPPSATHNPEFTMLEFYKSPGGMDEVMAELEALLPQLGEALCGAPRLPSGCALAGGFERLSVREAFAREVGVDIAEHPPGAAPEAFAAALSRSLGRPFDPADGWDDLFFRAFLDEVEPRLGRGRPTWLVDYPAHMAALAKLREDDPRWAQRFELYLDGVELANGFTELNDAPEQRARLVAEQGERAALGRHVPPLDEAFLEAVGRMPAAGGVAVGVDRLLMALTGAVSIEEVLLFPMATLAPSWRGDAPGA